jgi:collagenase-like PrtC family protease
MKRNKILVRINDLKEIEQYKKEGIINFLFPLQDFSIGYNTFKIDDLKKIKENIYLLANRVLNNEDIDNFRKIKDKLSFAKGIIFEDIGIYQILKDKDIPLIWSQAHFAINNHSINIWLDKVYSVVVANELEKNELEYIISNANKKVILPVLGLNMAMYSRRYLLSYYNEFKGLNQLDRAILKTKNGKEFLAVQNNYGCVLFYLKHFNLLKEINNFDDSKILFYYIDPNMLNSSEVIDILNGKDISYDNVFYETKTVYRIGDLND